MTALSHITVTRLEKAAVDNGFDLILTRDDTWLGFASTQSPLRGSDLANPPDLDRAERDRRTDELPVELAVSGSSSSRLQRSTILAFGRSAPNSRIRSLKQV